MTGRTGSEDEPDRRLKQVLAGIESDSSRPVYLVAGDLVIAERVGTNLGQALAAATESEVEVHHRPSSLSTLVEDLQTFSLFSGGKVVVAVDSALLADRRAAAELVGDALAATPLRTAEDLTAGEREAASRLLQGLHLFGVAAGPEPIRALEQIPDWAFATGKTARVSKKAAAERRESLVPLLVAAQAEGIQGVGEGGLARVSDAVRRGFPPHQHLVLVERSVVADHPLTALLREQGALIEVARVEADRQGWHGVGDLVAEIVAETGVEIDRDALEELVRRTLRQEGRKAEARADSTARFASELRKLAALADGARVTVGLVAETVEDRGEEDVWKLLDDIAGGRAGPALGRLERYLRGADDAVAARLSFFALLAGFCRQLMAVAGAVEASGVAADERSYPRFRERIAPALTRSVSDDFGNPLAGLHPFRLHRAYLAAGRFPAPFLRRLPFVLLETEVALKGGTRRADTALAALVAELARVAA